VHPFIALLDRGADVIIGGRCGDVSFTAAPCIRAGFPVRMFFLARIPGVKGTAGTAATTKQTMRSSPGYVWNVNHTVPIDDPMGLFPIHLTDAGC
jgi:hypothetical protein